MRLMLSKRRSMSKNSGCGMALAPSESDIVEFYPALVELAETVIGNLDAGLGMSAGRPQSGTLTPTPLKRELECRLSYLLLGQVFPSSPIRPVSR